MNERAIISGKGGTGKTCISAAFATLSNNLVVADCDVDAANLYLILQPEHYYKENFVTGHKAAIDYTNCTKKFTTLKITRFYPSNHPETLINTTFSRTPTKN